jgi:hypothetical protein
MLAHRTPSLRSGPGFAGLLRLCFRSLRSLKENLFRVVRRCGVSEAVVPANSGQSVGTWVAYRRNYPGVPTISVIQLTGRLPQREARPGGDFCPMR